MKDGYYLSTYLLIDELSYLTNVLKRHDQNISLWYKEGENVKLVHHWELERVTGFKQHKIAFYNVNDAREAINSLLKQYNLTLDDMVEIWGTPQLDTNNTYHSLDEYPDHTYHSIAHLFSSIMIDTDKFYNGNIIGLAVDGGPDTVVDSKAFEKNLYTGCVVKKGKVDMFHISSPGPFWFYSRGYYNLREGTLMALASAMKSEGFNPVDYNREIVNFKDILEMDKWYRELLDKFSLAKEEQGKLCSNFDTRFSDEDNVTSIVMKNIQRLSLESIERTVEDIIKKYDIDAKDTYISVSGGFALNCPSNSYIMNKFKFKGLISLPCVNDGGLSIGTGLYAFYKMNRKFNFKLENAYYGDEDNRLNEVVNSKLFSKCIKSVEKVECVKIVEDIMQSPIVWFNGRAEIGPRALGNRSIIADPRTEKSKDILNIIKKRQWWRPVAPIVLAEKVHAWFEDAYPSPYMLNTFKIKEEKVDLIPAVSHLDTSARVQTVNSSDNPLLYEVIRTFEKETGIPMLCNTSLNDAGEPIINRIEEALNFALRKKIHIAYINGYRVELFNFDEFEEKEPHERPLKMHKFSEEEKEQELKRLNPFNLPIEYLTTYSNMDILNSNYSLEKEEDVASIKRVVDIMIKSRKANIGLLGNELF